MDGFLASCVDEWMHQWMGEWVGKYVVTVFKPNLRVVFVPPVKT